MGRAQVQAPDGLPLGRRVAGTRGQDRRTRRRRRRNRQLRSRLRGGSSDGNRTCSIRPGRRRPRLPNRCVPVLRSGATIRALAGQVKNTRSATGPMPEINDPHHIKSCEFDPKELSIKLQFSGRADIDSINPVAEWVMEFVKNTSCAPGKEFEVELALREALANAIIHGCKGDKE